MKKRGAMTWEMAARRYHAGRSNLLLVVAFTAVNMVLALVGGNVYFLFSSYPPYLLTLFAQQFYYLTGDLAIAAGLLAAAVVLVLVYLLCWGLSKRRRGWMIVAAVLFAVDTAMLLVDMVAILQTSLLVDMAFHVWVLVVLIRAAACGRQALSTPEPVQAPGQEAWESAGAGIGNTVFYDASMGTPDTPSQGLPRQDQKYRVLVRADWNGYHIEVRRSQGLTELVINGQLYGTWQGAVETAYEISARLDGHVFATCLTGRFQTIEVDGQVIARKMRLY